MTDFLIEYPNGRCTGREAVAEAVKLLYAAGFELNGAAAESNSKYFRRPGRTTILRVSDHSAGRVNLSRHLQVAEVVMADTVLDHVEDDYEIDLGDGETETLTREVEIRHTGLFPGDVADLVAEAIAEYDATVDSDEETDDE